MMRTTLLLAGTAAVMGIATPAPTKAQTLAAIKAEDNEVANAYTSFVQIASNPFGMSAALEAKLKRMKEMDSPVAFIEESDDVVSEEEVQAQASPSPSITETDALARIAALEKKCTFCKESEEKVITAAKAAVAAHSTAQDKSEILSGKKSEETTAQTEFDDAKEKLTLDKSAIMAAFNVLLDTDPQTEYDDFVKLNKDLKVVQQDIASKDTLLETAKTAVTTAQSDYDTASDAADTADTATDTAGTVKDKVCDNEDYSYVPPSPPSGF
jgi:hypothetical protein